MAHRTDDNRKKQKPLKTLRTTGGYDKVSPARKRAMLQRDTLSRAKLGAIFQRRAKRVDLTSRQILGALLGEAPSQMSRLMSGHFHEFSADRLLGFFVLLGTDVTVTLTHKRSFRRAGKVRIVEA